MFISTLTENQIIAAILTFAMTLLLWLLDGISKSAGVSGTLGAILSYLSVFQHLEDFMSGVIGTSHIIFYLSLTLVGLFLTYRSLDSLRWRG
jgi:ABC-2 type transport system permease protein